MVLKINLQKTETQHTKISYAASDDYTARTLATLEDNPSIHSHIIASILPDTKPANPQQHAATATTKSSQILTSAPSTNSRAIHGTKHGLQQGRPPASALATRIPCPKT
jgi:hypothetical protein